MSRSAVRLEPVDNETVEHATALLSDAGLPTQDIRGAPDWLYMAHSNGRRIGVGGIQSVDGYGLVRSVVIEPAVRGQGYGSALCQALERRGTERGIEELYLLTTTAATFFEAIGYETCDRSAAPPAIQKTDQFDALCPATASCLRKSIAHGKS
ncbi:arsenic resistance N-acetyltransferase ArsN2 [Halocatena halophila]|uniref:arsenic resistance N-acetyltransferase ArsN2 n=1 Tax=Halocatena halophila TaxID=2814576 RepID=UPI002ED11D85